jgi:hypothetical protein
MCWWPNAPDRALEYREGQLQAGYLVSISNVAEKFRPAAAAVTLQKNAIEVPAALMHVADTFRPKQPLR